MNIDNVHHEIAQDIDKHTESNEDQLECKCHHSDRMNEHDTHRVERNIAVRHMSMDIYNEIENINDIGEQCRACSIWQNSPDQPDWQWQNIWSIDSNRFDIVHEQCNSSRIDLLDEYDHVEVSFYLPANWQVEIETEYCNSTMNDIQHNSSIIEIHRLQPNRMLINEAHVNRRLACIWQIYWMILHDRFPLNQTMYSVLFEHEREVCILTEKIVADRWVQYWEQLKCVLIDIDSIHPGKQVNINIVHHRSTIVRQCLDDIGRHRAWHRQEQFVVDVNLFDW
jgi:hypothetical protein